AVAVLAAALVLVPAAGAAAHVHVHPDSTAAGGYAQLTFRVPTESDTASTTALRVQLPADTPFTYVAVRPLPGWSATVERGTLPEPVEISGATVTEAPVAVVWTAEPGAEVGPGEYQEFAISAGPLPAAGTEVLLPAVQTYSDGSVVAWEQSATGGEEPELPAPEFTTTAAEDDHHAGATPAAGSGDGSTGDGSTPAAGAAGAAAVAGGSDAGAWWL
ncbi:YcnI family protein, partial [Kineococcus glutinatus]|uniref:YcnI family copper-binding membrane protein n=1 Tax=Kineococcus glutinatus TaxID=1070872 RepID=UPI0031EFD987